MEKAAAKPPLPHDLILESRSRLTVTGVQKVLHCSAESAALETGKGILHLSGLIAAMSHETTECCLALAKAAKQYGTLVSFDLNYRATFWKGREDALSEAVVGVGQFIMVECDHRAAVSDENSGHLFHGDSSFLVVFPIKVSFLY